MTNTKEIIKGKFDDAPIGNGSNQEFRDRSKATTAGPETGVAGGMMEAVKEQVQAMGAGCSELAGKAKDTAQEWASSIGDAAVHAKDKIRETASATAEKVGEMGQDVTALIRRHPFASLLAAFGVGFLVARVIQRS